MKVAPHTLTILYAALVACAGCSHMPGYPKAGDEVLRPAQELNFQSLYKQNCSGCHGENGRGGGALPLNNAAYLQVAGADNLRTVTAQGENGTLMPAFARTAGGMLTDQQIEALVQGMLHEWARSSEFAGVNLPSYSSSVPGNSENGNKVFEFACARCHGADGTGVKGSSEQGASAHSIVDSSYLALINDQSLRSIVIAGHPDTGMPDWRSYMTGPGARPLSSDEISDIVAWLAAHRTTAGDQAMNSPGKSSNGPAAKEAQ